MTSSTIPDPAPGQVWEDKYVGNRGRRVRLTAGGHPRWEGRVIAHPLRPHMVGKTVSLSFKTLYSGWRFIPEEER